MFAVYEINTNQVVAMLNDRRIALSRAKALTAEYAHEGYEFAVKKFR
jgi:hypothetical protein